ncbi:subtilisin-like protease SBT4.1 [Nicotiana tabacum]|uniref:Subtilisin-like protease SBT4.1 n=1 Tax=Nicotiana tabacum TaxID=4097 RepID=A0A1S4CK01_TOBAC|nr:subtilisin-like protease SBT4.1 [Nicotiana tomentosiformis]XP_016501249.1 PREDICTED: subtilisin-like protease SBT4.1 [Nicotiana tabacum]
MAQGKYLSSTTFTFLILISHFSFIIARTASFPEDDKKIYIVFTENSDYEKILATVLGSEDAAKQAIIYPYKNELKGFAASLTPEQASRLKKQRGVLNIIPDRSLNLDSGFEGQT